jgi:hypothetical protein
MTATVLYRGKTPGEGVLCAFIAKQFWKIIEPRSTLSIGFKLTFVGGYVLVCLLAACSSWKIGVLHPRYGNLGQKADGTVFIIGFQVDRSTVCQWARLVSWWSMVCLESPHFLPSWFRSRRPPCQALREDQWESICKHQSANCRRSVWGVARIHCDSLMQFNLLSDLQLCLSCSGFIYNHINHTHLSVTLYYVYIIYICSPFAICYLHIYIYIIYIYIHVSTNFPGVHFLNQQIMSTKSMI